MTFKFHKNHSNTATNSVSVNVEKENKILELVLEIGKQIGELSVKVDNANNDIKYLKNQIKLLKRK